MFLLKILINECIQKQNKDRKHFFLTCLQNLTTKEILNNHRERYLSINGAQAAIYEAGIIKFKNYDK